MKLLEAKEKLKKMEDIPFGDMFKNRNDFIKNKGKVGQVLELILGLKNTNKNIDFEDGELKTNKCDEYGNPLETICITQISSIIDELYKKKRNLRILVCMKKYLTFYMFLFVKKEIQRNGSS